MAKAAKAFKRRMRKVERQLCSMLPTRYDIFEFIYLTHLDELLGKEVIEYHDILKILNHQDFDKVLDELNENEKFYLLFGILQVMLPERYNSNMNLVKDRFKTWFGTLIHDDWRIALEIVRMDLPELNMARALRQIMESALEKERHKSNPLLRSKYYSKDQTYLSMLSGFVTEILAKKSKKLNISTGKTRVILENLTCRKFKQVKSNKRPWER